MRMLLACVLALTSSVMGYQISVPNQSVGWTNSGGQPLVWQRVDTDPQNFTVVLTNVNEGSANDQILAALVDGTLGNTTCNPPSGGWPTGTGFRVNFVTSTENLNTILAQSGQFNISAATSNSTTSSISGTQTTVPTVIYPTTPGASSTTATLAPAKSNGALRHVQAHVGLWGGALGFLGFFLA